jgi:hypothetical protein
MCKVTVDGQDLTAAREGAHEVSDRCKAIMRMIRNGRGLDDIALEARDLAARAGAVEGTINAMGQGGC